MAERQDICTQFIKEDRLYTPYAREMIVKQELFAMEGEMEARRQGNNTYLIDETIKDNNPQNRRDGKDGPMNRIERHTVDLNKHTCTCSFPKDNKLPCKHDILAMDFNDQSRKTKEGQKQFRKDWVTPYFWAENYVRGYKDVTVRAPDVNNNIYVDVPKGRRQVD